MKQLENQRGMVLLLVLVVVTLLAALLSEFSFSSLVDLRLAETFRDSTRAYYLANGGVKAGRMLLQEDTNGYDGPDELWSQGVVGYPVGDGTVSITIEDLGGKVDLNRLVSSLGNIDPVVKDRCLRLFSELQLADPAGLVDALIDWLDPGSDEQPLGAESTYYLGLPHPYPAKNGPLDSLDELLLVKGFDADILAKLAPHVTVYGSEKINVNSASTEVLLALSDQMDADAAKRIVDARQEQPFKTLQQLQQLPGMETLYGAIYTYIDVKSDSFRIRSLGQVGDGSRTIEAVVRKTGDVLLYQRVN
jgi:general secretion pathway protein K